MKPYNLVIFGATTNITKDIIKLSPKNYFFHLFYRNEEKISSLKNSPVSKKCTFNKIDLEDTTMSINKYKKFLEKNPKIDGFIYLAGTRGHKIEECDFISWRKVFSVNLESAYFTGVETCKTMVANNICGKLIFIASTTAYYGGAPDYSASKAGILSITKSLAKHFATNNICINSITPGYIDTEANNWNSEKLAKKLQNVPLGKLCSSKEIANLVLYLLSNKSSYITGSSIDINGGLIFR